MWFTLEQDWHCQILRNAIFETYSFEKKKEKKKNVKKKVPEIFNPSLHQAVSQS